MPVRMLTHCSQGEVVCGEGWVCVWGEGGGGRVGGGDHCSQGEVVCGRGCIGGGRKGVGEGGGVGRGGTLLTG